MAAPAHQARFPEASGSEILRQTTIGFGSRSRPRSGCGEPSVDGANVAVAAQRPCGAERRAAYRRRPGDTRLSVAARPARKAESVIRRV